MKFEIKYPSENPTVEEQIVIESLRLLNKFLVNSAKNNTDFNSKSYRMTIHMRRNYHNLCAIVYLKYVKNYSPVFYLRSDVLTISDFGQLEEFLISDPNIFDKVIALFKFRLNIQ